MRIGRSGSRNNRERSRQYQVMVIMISTMLEILYPYLKFAIGTLYPSYKTWKSLKRKDDFTRRRWLKYWVIFGAFQIFEFGADYSLYYVVPFYYTFKLVLIIWLMMGTKLIFDSIVNKELAKREKTIDRTLTKLSKIRDEFVAIVWSEVTQCSVKIIASIMSGSLSVLAKSGTVSTSNSTSPFCSENELSDHETDQNNQLEPSQAQQELCYLDEAQPMKALRYSICDYNQKDVNENPIAMEWSTETNNREPSFSNQERLLRRKRRYQQ